MLVCDKCKAEVDYRIAIEDEVGWARWCLGCVYRFAEATKNDQAKEWRLLNRNA